MAQSDDKKGPPEIKKPAHGTTVVMKDILGEPRKKTAQDKSAETPT